MHAAFKPQVMVVLAAMMTVFAAAVIVAESVWQPTNAERTLDGMTGDANQGKYLLQIGGCISCHTDISNVSSVLSGGGRLDTRFGVFYAPNISAHVTDGIGGWSLDEFARAMTHGVSRDGRSLVPVFPYTSFASLTDQDIAHLWAAIQALPKSPGKSTANDPAFPFSQNGTLAFWQRVFARPEVLTPVEGRSPAWHRGRYLARALVNCATCHTPRNLLGARLSERRYQGGEFFVGLDAPDISPTGLLENGWTKENLKRAMETGLRPDGSLLDARLPKALRHGLEFWTTDDREAIVLYLIDGPQ